MTHRGASGDTIDAVTCDRTQLPAPPIASLPNPSNAAYLTASIPGIGGRIKLRTDDFLVEEIPAYEPCGEGEHIYLFVEKTNLSTMHVVRMLADHFGVKREAVGFAGLKDKLAVTRQVFSVHTPGRKSEDFPAFSQPRVTVHWVDRHTNKLRRGHLKGNRFIIRVREVEPSRVVHAARALAMLAKLGVPNRIGEQRFGHLQNNHLVGRGLLLHDHQAVLDALLGPSAARPEAQADGRRLYSEGRFSEAMDAFPRSLHGERRVLAALARGDKPKRAVYALERSAQSFYLTAFQSAVFNAVLDRRMAERGPAGIASLVEGDLAFKHDSGAVFPIGAAEAVDDSIQGRLTGLEISPSGPMWGARMTRAGAAIDAMEVEELARLGVSVQNLAEFAERSREPLSGERRSLRVPLLYPDVEAGVDEHGSYIKCVFELPRGSFATTVMREVMKPVESDPLVDDADED